MSLNPMKASTRALEGIYVVTDAKNSQKSLLLRKAIQLGYVSDFLHATGL
jgi:hypothetical protein